MAVKLNLMQLNKLFEKQSTPNTLPRLAQPAEDRLWIDQFFARVHLVDSINGPIHYQSSVNSSPLSHNSTLVDEETWYNYKIPGEDSLYATDQSWQDTCGHDPRKGLQSLCTDIPSYASNYSPSSNSSPSSSVYSANTAFNPHAAPFVPICTQSPQSPSSPLSADPDLPWFPFFWQGVSSRDHNTQATNATALVNSVAWDADSLAALSQHFCWKGAEVLEDGVAQVATFGQLVHERIIEAYGDWYANCFTRHIRELVVGHFKGCWKSDHPMAINHLNLPSHEYLSSALSLTTFIGALFAHGLLPRSTIHHCLSVLVAELSTVEHIHAIHLLVLHATAKLWRGKDVNKAIKDFVTSFTQRASCIAESAEKASVMGACWTKGEIRAWIKEIADMINRWQVTRRVQQDDSNLDFVLGDKLNSFGLQMARRR